MDTTEANEGTQTPYGSDSSPLLTREGKKPKLTKTGRPRRSRTRVLYVPPAGTRTLSGKIRGQPMRKRPEASQQEGALTVAPPVSQRTLHRHRAKALEDLGNLRPKMPKARRTELTASMERYGVNEDYLAKRLKEGLEATSMQRLYDKGTNTIASFEDVDHRMRQKYLETALRIRGDLLTEKDVQAPGSALIIQIPTLNLTVEEWNKKVVPKARSHKAKETDSQIVEAKIVSEQNAEENDTQTR